MPLYYFEMKYCKALDTFKIIRVNFNIYGPTDKKNQDGQVHLIIHTFVSLHSFLYNLFDSKLEICVRDRTPFKKYADI